jgi:hypothetical protein
MFKVRPAKRRAMSLAGFVSPKAVWGQCQSRPYTQALSCSHVKMTWRASHEPRRK